MFDLVIKGGTLIDGTGAPGRTADVAINDDRVMAVGHGLGPGRREIDADGLLVTPGFVDIHTHYDAQVTWDPLMTPSSTHGVTSVVMGSCGVGFAPARPSEREELIELMEAIEDIPGAALSEGIDWRWESFPAYLDALEEKRTTLDFAAQIPHAPVRMYVMGQRGAENTKASAAEIAEMSSLVEGALRAGALGFSSSRTSLHRCKNGELMPGTYADEAELFGIADALKRSGRGVFQLACEHGDVPAELEWMKRMAREIQRPVSFNLSQYDGNPALARQVLAALEDAEDLPLVAQVAGRGIGVLHTWRGTAHPFAGCTSWLNVAWLPWDECLAELKKPEVRQRIIDEVPPDLGEFGNFVTRTWAKMFPMAAGVEYEPGPDDSIAAIAARTGLTPAEVAFDALMDRDGEGTLYFPLFNYSDGDLEIVRELHTHPKTRMGLSDAGAHCGAICDGGMPTFMLTHWTRDRTRGDKIPLEHIVRRQTSETAALFGLNDRGIIAPGYRADLNVIDYEGLGFDRPKLQWDLPAGGRRFMQDGRGYVATILRGELVREQDEHTEARPGRLVRGPQSI